jgi:ActR/RegA family two-component response regulator
MSFRKPVIFIADDDENWLNKMENSFLKKGHKTQRTRFSEKALKMIKDDEDHQIKGLVLDWLFKKIDDSGSQSTSPETIISHIVLNRPDVAIIVVSDAPLDESWNPEGDPKLAIKLYHDILEKVRKYSNSKT